MYRVSAIPLDALRDLNRLWLEAGGGPLRKRGWTQWQLLGNVTDYVALWSLETWLERRLSEAGL